MGGPRGRFGARAKRFTAGPEDSSPRWSPDGTALAFIADRGKSPQLYVAPLDGGEPVCLTRMPYGVSQPAWSPDGKMLAFAARTGDWKKPDEKTAVEKAAPRVVTDLYNRYDGVGWFDSRRSHLFVVSRGDSAGQPDPIQVTGGDWDDLEPAWSPDGKELAFVSDRSRTRHDEVHRDVWVVRVPKSGRAKPRRLTRGLGTSASPRWSPDGRTIAYLGHEHEDGFSDLNTHLLVVPAAGGKDPRSVSESLDRTVWGLLWATGTAHAWTGGDELIFIAADAGRLSVYRTAVEKPQPKLVIGGDRQIAAVHEAKGTLAFTSQWPSSAPELYCRRKGTGGDRRISDANPEIRALRLATPRRISHTSPDGLRIESFVLDPPPRTTSRAKAVGRTAPKKPVPRPTVLEIHGGPHSWHPQAALLALYQSLVTAGYSVVLVNPRGSHGYGEEFAGACVGDWGGGDYEDLMAVIDRLVAGKAADPHRLYVCGYSYGGYMTSWVVGQTNRFAAGCVSAPVTDLASMWGTSDIPNFASHEVGGFPWDRPDVFAKRSPVAYLADIRTPLQIFHWEGDLRCPVGQSDQLFQGLRKLGREAVMVRYPGGYHIVRAPSQMVDFVARHLEWFETHQR